MNGWRTQLKKGAAELVVLSLLGSGELHGVKILEELGRNGGLLSSGTVYPLLTRLEREGKLSSRWSVSAGARAPRKYYKITPDGHATLSQMRESWTEFSSYVSSIVEGKGYVSAAAGC